MRSSRVVPPLTTWLILLALTSAAHAATFTVDRTDDVATASACDDAAPDDCSLRGAVARANSTAGNDIISVPAGTYVLSVATPCTFLAARGESFFGSTPALCLNDNTEITGAGAAVTTIQHAGTDRIFAVSVGKTVSMSGVTLTGGAAGFGFAVGGGGAILNHGTLAVSDSVITGNTAAGGGGAGIYNRGTLTVTRSRFTLNTTVGSGGAINSTSDAGAGRLTLTDSTLTDNTGMLGGGVISDGVATVTGSTINRNTATTVGGALRNGGLGVMTVVNSTLSGNRATIGGALESGGSSPIGTALHLASVTITDNTAQFAGGVFNSPGQTMTVRNTIIAGNTATESGAADCQGTLTSGGYNLIQNVTSCSLVGDTTGNITGQDPKLAPLVDSGGPTPTHALLADSPAIDAGNPAGCTDPMDVLLITDQRGLPRSVDGDDDGTARCDIGAAELTSELAITRIQPAEGGNGAPLIAVVHGSGFESGATVKLVRAGESDIVGIEPTVGENGGVLLATFDLTGKAAGAWDVVVTNPDGTKGTRPGAFTVAAPRAPELWIDITGPSLVRVGRSYRYLFLYGNRGNTDAFAVPLVLSVASVVRAVPSFEIAPPPRQFGKIVIQEWGRFYHAIVVGENPKMQQYSLVLPIVPAGFSGALEVIVTPPFDSENEPFAIRLEYAPPMVDEQGPLPEALAKLVQGARAQSERLFKYTIPVGSEVDLLDYLNVQLDTLVQEGIASLVDSFGTAPRVYSLTQLVYDLAAFGYIWSLEHPSAPMTLVSQGPAAGGLGFSTAADVPPLSCGCGSIPLGLLCCEGCSCSTSADKDIKPPKPCLARLKDIGKDDCKKPETPQECKNIGFDVVQGKGQFGEDVTYCTNNPKCLITNTVGLTCIRFPVEPRVSHDPNDKSGPIGGGPGRAITAGVPLSYTIQFENKPAATAPAAEVIVTDQLDPGRVELATLALGPMGFGSTQVVPPPGSTEFLRDVDLRPANNLIVRIDARLDPATALLTWRFTSLDPDTMEPTDDPLAGFLPPNVTPPQGDGFVAFTVDPKPGLPTDTEIANQARIFLDVNPPIDTPVWRNTIDATPPTSTVTSVTPVGACTQDLEVAWSGADQGSGVGSFSILVSEDGGPFTTWLTTDQIAGTFHGKWGRRYTFVSVAEDRAGNTEEAPASGVEATVPACGPFDLAVTRIKAARTIKLLPSHPARTAVVKVQVQNRSARAQIIPDAATLASLVTLAADSTGACPAARVSLHTGKAQRPLPFVLGARKKLDVVFDLILDCPGTFQLSAAVHQPALGGVDSHAEDDVCPRPGRKPALKDPLPDGKLTEAGCGGRRADGTLGGPVLINVISR